MPGRRRDGPAQAVTEAFRNSAAIPLPGEFHSPAKASSAVQPDMCNPLFTLNFSTIAGRSEGRTKKFPRWQRNLRCSITCGWAGSNGCAPSLFDDDPRRRTALGVGAGDLLPDPGGDATEDERMRVVGLGDGDRCSSVEVLADPDVRRPLAKNLGPEPLGFLARAAVAEDLAAAAAMGAQEIA